MMRVSVLLPTWNRAPLIGSAIASVLREDPAEVIVVDDGSTDGTPAVLSQFGTRIRVIAQANRGVAAALNVAQAAAGGDALAFIDSDDLWMPGRLLLQCGALGTDATLDGVFGHLSQFRSPDGPAYPPQPGLSKGTLLVRAGAFRRIGPFNEAARRADFVDWFARAIGQGFRWTMLPEVLSLRRLHACNMGRIERPAQHDDYLLTFKAFLDRRRARA